MPTRHRQAVLADRARRSGPGVLSAGGGRVVTTEALPRRVWGRRGSDDTDRVRTALKKLRVKLGDERSQPSLHLQRARRRLPLREAWIALYVWTCPKCGAKFVNRNQ